MRAAVGRVEATAPGGSLLSEPSRKIALVGCAFVEHRDESEETAEAGGAAGERRQGTCTRRRGRRSTSPRGRARGPLATTRSGAALKDGALWGTCSRARGRTSSRSTRELDTLMTPLLEEGCGK